MREPTSLTPAPTGLAVPHELAAGQFELVLRRLADDLTYGSDPSRFVGSGTDYVQSRGYTYGDSVRSIDWRVTARTGRLHVKEYEATKRTPVFLLLDTSASMAVSSGPLSKHDAAVWIASTLALVAIRRRSPVAILGCGEREGGAAPTLSRGRVWRLIENLRRPAYAERTRLGERLARVEALATHTSAVVVISDMHDPDALPGIRRLAQRHDCIVLQLRDPAEAAPLRAGFLRAREAESGRLFLSGGRSRSDPAAAELRRHLIDAGADHVVVRTDEPVIPALQRLLRGHGRGWRAPR